MVGSNYFRLPSVWWNMKRSCHDLANHGKQAWMESEFLITWITNIECMDTTHNNRRVLVACGSGRASD
uniref:Uncharacterized protein n=1 Tax=Physcomitrium patens TaxID=3218 RepID=A0A2K1IMV1_PHYPA|nr:hypothetical protein PHYPA_026921 [Physcomitrium patens]